MWEKISKTKTSQQTRPASWCENVSLSRIPLSFIFYMNMNMFFVYILSVILTKNVNTSVIKNYIKKISYYPKMSLQTKNLTSFRDGSLIALYHFVVIIFPNAWLIKLIWMNKYQIMNFLVKNRKSDCQWKCDKLWNIVILLFINNFFLTKFKPFYFYH